MCKRRSKISHYSGEILFSFANSRPREQWIFASPLLGYFFLFSLSLFFLRINRPNGRMIANSVATVQQTLLFLEVTFWPSDGSETCTSPHAERRRKDETKRRADNSENSEDEGESKKEQCGLPMKEREPLRLIPLQCRERDRVSARLQEAQRKPLVSHRCRRKR